VRLHRARRKARIEHRKRTKRAGLRFWVVLVLLLVASVVLSVTIWNEIQNLFGL
jgi:predicted nucleic acid-binding Zn ribbon protein